MQLEWVMGEAVFRDRHMLIRESRAGSIPGRVGCGFYL
jgi:hypothetical protein